MISPTSENSPILRSSTNPLERLHRAKEKLRTSISTILAREASNPASSPDWLAFQLTVVYREACAVWHAISGRSDRVQTEVHNDRLWLSQGSGSLELVWDERHGWSSVLLGLHGEYLANCLAAWPAFHVPTGPLQPLNITLTDLRRLLSQPDIESVVHIAEILDTHVHPLVQEYVQHHRPTWPEPLKRAFDNHQNRRFASHSLQLLKHQNRQELELLLNEAYTLHPRDERWLSEQLQPWLQEINPIWSKLLDRNIELHTEVYDVATIDISTQLGLDRLKLVWGAVGWMVEDAPGRSVIDAFMHLLTEIEYSHEDDLYSACDVAMTLEEEEAMRYARLEDYCLSFQPGMLREAKLDDILLEEEHWMVGQYFQGMQFSIDDDEHPDYISA